MHSYKWWLLGLVFLVGTARTYGDPTDLRTLLGEEIVGPRQALAEMQQYLEARIPKMPKIGTRAEWEREAGRLRSAVLERVVYRGVPAAWRDGKIRIEWLETLQGGPGYRIKKLRYEAVPGLWIPALLYEPLRLSGRVPVHLAVNGHEGDGKSVAYKQVRCINLARRGTIVLNVEWLGMGQLNLPGYHHGCMNQLDLCGTSGLAPFYLSLKRGLDVLLAQEHADPQRVGVSGLSGGGWQTIIISALDTRVTLTNPVAGYSGFLTRIRHFQDLGDSEQLPNDLATIADYTHLTALLAPRPALLTYNSRDNCCFESAYALPPLLAAGEPIYRLYGKATALRSHVNNDPGTHNFERDNRQALYRIVGDSFFTADKNYPREEISCNAEIKTREQLNVALPAHNADFNSLARALSKNLPHCPELPGNPEAARQWQARQRERLRGVVRAKEYTVKVRKKTVKEQKGVRATMWRLTVGDVWSVPVVELVRGQAKGTVLLVHSAGKKACFDEADRLLTSGKRVLVVDPLMFGEVRWEPQSLLHVLTSVGDRPLGVQASQLAAVARSARSELASGPVTVQAIEPRACLAALVAAALETEAIARLECHKGLGSLKELIESNYPVDYLPEAFCFGLLEALDIQQMETLVPAAPMRR